MSNLKVILQKVRYACYREFSSQSIQKMTRKEITITFAMQKYMEAAKQHVKFMEKEAMEYELGRKHLANIMGADPDNFSDKDAKRAIQYLLPSGLMNEQARPMFLRPEDLFPKRKESEFHMNGRPLHHMYYTGFPNFYDIMHTAVQRWEKMKQFEDEQWQQGMTTPPEKLNLQASRWLERDEMKDVIIEPIHDKQYNAFLILMERLAEHPYAYTESDFIMKYRVPHTSLTTALEVLPIEQDSHGNLYVDSTGKRKTCDAKVRVWVEGTGKVTINGKPFLAAMSRIIDRRQILYPLLLAGKLNKVDIEAYTWRGGPTGVAGAIRYAVSKALCSLVDKETVLKMKVAGLLTRDVRRRERKKPGQEGARRKYTWKKR